MYVPPKAEAAYLAPVSDLLRRAEIFEQDGVTRWAGGAYDNRLIDGQVTIDYGRDERRIFDLEIDNTDHDILHSPDSLWYDKVLKIFHGIRYYDADLKLFTTWETQVGEFVIDSINENHFPYSISISGRDYTKKCLTSKFSQATQFNKGATIESLIQAIATSAGISKFLLPVTGKTTLKDYFFERGTERWAAMKEIAESYGFELYFNAQGYLILRTMLDPVTSPTAYTLRTGPVVGNLVSYTKSVNDARIYNHIVVTGESADQETIPVWAEALNTEPSSPTRISELGDRLYQYTSSFITTTAQAQTVADSFLKIHALEEFNLNFTSVAFPWLETGEIVEFVDPRPSPGQPTKFLLDTLTLPLGLGAMSGTAKRVTVVG